MFYTEKSENQTLDKEVTKDILSILDKEGILKDGCATFQTERKPMCYKVGLWNIEVKNGVINICVLYQKNAIIDFYQIGNKEICDIIVEWVESYRNKSMEWKTQKHNMMNRLYKNEL